MQQHKIFYVEKEQHYYLRDYPSLFLVWQVSLLMIKIWIFLSSSPSDILANPSSEVWEEFEERTALPPVLGYLEIFLIGLSSTLVFIFMKTWLEINAQVFFRRREREIIDVNFHDSPTSCKKFRVGYITNLFLCYKLENEIQLGWEINRPLR